MQEACFIQPKWPAPSNVKALTTLRRGGKSLGPYASFNLAAHVGDTNEALEYNRKHLRKIANLPQEPVWLKQVHGVKAISLDAHLKKLKDSATEIDLKNLGTEESQNLIVPEADASFTTNPGVVAAVLTADCLPILVCDNDGSEVAAIHAGWRGLASGVIESTFKNLHSQRKNLMAWLGPAISKKAFIVGEEVKQAFSKEQDNQAFTEIKNSALTEKRWSADLYQLARFRLQALGVEQIFGGNFCTYTDEQQFYSYRRSNQTGRMATLIWLS